MTKYIRPLRWQVGTKILPPPQNMNVLGYEEWMQPKRTAPPPPPPPHPHPLPPNVYWETIKLFEIEIEIEVAML